MRNYNRPAVIAVTSSNVTVHFIFYIESCVSRLQKETTYATPEDAVLPCKINAGELRATIARQVHLANWSRRECRVRCRVILQLYYT